FSVFPRDVNRVVQMQQQALAAVKKSEAEKIVVDKRKQWPQHDVDHAESDFALGHNHLRAQRRVAVHVLDVVGERGVGVVDQVAPTAQVIVPSVIGLLSRFELHIFVNRAILEVTAAAPKHTQLGVGIKSAMAHPSTEEIISPRQPESRGVAQHVVRTGKYQQDELSRNIAEFLVRV